MKHIYRGLWLICISLLFLAGCGEHTFDESEQNPAPYTKKVSIADLKKLYKDQSYKLSDVLYIEAIVTYIDNNSAYLQDDAGSAIKILNVNNIAGIKLNDQISARIGGKTLDKDSPFYVINDIDDIEVTGEGIPVPVELEAEVIGSKIMEYAASVISITRPVLGNITETDGFLKFDAEDETGIVTCYIRKGEVETLPPSCASITGVLSVVNGNPCITLRTKDDIGDKLPDMFELIVKNSGLVAAPISYELKELSPGVIQLQGSYTPATDMTKVSNFTIFEVDLSNPDARVEAATGNKSALGMEKVSVMAQNRNIELLASEPGYRVWGGMSGNFYIPAGQPNAWSTMGPLIVNGEILREEFADTDATKHFLAILKDGKCMVGKPADFPTTKDQIQQAIGGRLILQNKEVTNNSSSKHARVAYGYGSKGTKFYMFIGDYKRASDQTIDGFGPKEMALILKSIGATDALYGQGSSPATAVGRIDDILLVINKPINYPTENTIGDGWLVIGKDPVTP